MTDDLSRPSPLDLSAVFQQAAALYKKNLPLFLFGGLIYGFANVSDALVYKFFQVSSVGLFMAINFLVTAWATIMIFYGASQAYQGQEIGAGDALRYAKNKYPKFVLVSLLLFSIVLLGAVFFIIPGLYFMTIFLLVDLLVVLEERPLEDIFRRSAYLIKGHFWKAFSLFLVMTCLLIAPSFLLQLFKGMDPVLSRTIVLMAGVFIFPYYNIVQVALYYRLKESKPDEEITEDRAWV